MPVPKSVGSFSENVLFIITEICWCAVLGAFLMNLTGILSLLGDFWFDFLVWCFCSFFSSNYLRYGFRFGHIVFYLSCIHLLCEVDFQSDFESISCGLVTVLPLSLYMVGFWKGFWCRFLTALNIVWSLLTVSSCGIASICFYSFFHVFWNIVSFFVSILLFSQCL